MNFGQILAKAKRYCASKETCIQQIREKLEKWGVVENQQDNIIQILIDEKFIDEQRFAKAFAHDKFHFNKWGKIKIKYKLKQLNIPDKYINQALSEIDEKEYFSVAEKLVTEKLKTLNSDDYYKTKQKLLAFISNKGYEVELAYEIINNHLKNN